MLAAVGTGAYETVEAAAGQIVHVVDTIEPDAEIAARYEEKYRQFQQIYPALKPVFDSIAKCESSLNLRGFTQGNLLLGESKFSYYRDKVARNGEEYEVFY